MRNAASMPLSRRLAMAAALAILAAPTLARAHAPIVLAHLEEESIGAADLTPTPTPSPSPGAQSTDGATPTPTPSATPTVVIGPPIAEPVPVPTTSEADQPPLDVGSITPTMRVSDSSLSGEIARTANPARVASLRITDQARAEVVDDKPDDAIRTLGRAVSIDPGNPFAYFYLGRAYMLKKDDQQAMSFFKRAEIGFGSANPTWLSETLSFEGLAYEESDHSNAAAAAYQQAVQVNPGNLMARVGYTRLAPSITPPEPAAPPGAPSDNAAQPPPDVAPPPGAPQSAAPSGPPGENAPPTD